MSGVTTADSALIQASLWSSDLKEIVKADLMAQTLVRMIPTFDGDVLNIPSIGQFQADDYTEDTEIKMRGIVTGNSQFSINKYKSSGTYVTDKMKQDSYVISQVQAMFVPEQRDAIMRHFEVDVMNLANAQTLNGLNLINGAAHRFVASGTGNTVTLNDLQRIRYGFQKAYMPMQRIVGIVCPEFEIALTKLFTTANAISYNPQREGIISTALSDGTRFIGQFLGIDFYVSHYLPDANETIGGLTTTSGKANIFFTTGNDRFNPFIASWKQAPMVETVRRAERQRDEYFTTARYGVKLEREDNLIVMLTDTANPFA